MARGHRAFVERWLQRRAGGSLPLLAGDALRAIWVRAQRSLSRLSLSALMRCALDSASAHHPLLAEISVGPAGFEIEPLLRAPPDELIESVSALLVEILAVVGETAGEALAAALESELLRVHGSRRTPLSGVRPVRTG
jgi:hypothetical protein